MKIYILLLQLLIDFNHFSLTKKVVLAATLILNTFDGKVVSEKEMGSLGCTDTLK